MRSFFGIAYLCALGFLPLLGCSDTVDTGGSGGAAGVGGMAGEGGAGGTPAGCTLTGQWETIGSWGSDTLGYGNVAVLQNPIDDARRYWTSYYTIENEHCRWRSGSGMVDAPQASFAWNDDFGLDASKASLTTRVAIHPSGAVFTGGNAVDALDWQWGIVRQGTTAGFEISDKFIHGRDGVYVSNVSSILVDNQGNVWAAYMSRPDTWFPKLTTLRKMACLDTEPPDPC